MLTFVLIEAVATALAPAAGDGVWAGGTRLFLLMLGSDVHLLVEVRALQRVRGVRAPVVLFDLEQGIDRPHVQVALFPVVSLRGDVSGAVRAALAPNARVAQAGFLRRGLLRRGACRRPGAGGGLGLGAAAGRFGFGGGLRCRNSGGAGSAREVDILSHGAASLSRFARRAILGVEASLGENNRCGETLNGLFTSAGEQRSQRALTRPWAGALSPGGPRVY